MSDKLNINYISEEMYKRENKSKREYDINDCVLIRTTDVFPKDKIVETPLNGNAYDFGSSVIFREAVIHNVQKMYPDVMSKEYDEALKDYKIFFDIPRSTIHFTINGLVSSHMYGNFDDRPYIIIEPLKYHVEDPSLKGLRVEDTYFNSDINLSDESILMIPKSFFESNKDNLEFLESLKGFNVVVFDGNDKQAVDFVIRSFGYNAFDINNHGYRDAFFSDNDETRMIEFVRGYATEHEIPQDRHCYSEEYKEDNQRMIDASIKREKEFLEYVMNSVMIPIELKNKIEAELCNCIDISYLAKSPSIFKLVEIIGLESLKVLMEEFNNKCISEINEKNNIK